MLVLDQRERVVVLLLYVVILIVTSFATFGSLSPPTSDQGLWFYAGLASLLLGNLIVTPFFTRPADTVAYCVSGIVALLAAYILDDSDRLGFEKVLWIAVLTYQCVLLAIAMVAIVLKDSTGRLQKTSAMEAFRLSEHLGDARWVFASVFFMAVLVFHREDTTDFAILLTVGVTVVVLRPLELFYSIGRRAWRAIRGTVTNPVVGDLIGRQQPGVILIKQAPNVSPVIGSLVAIRGQDDDCFVGILLDRFFLAGETWLRAGNVDTGELSDGELASLKQLATYQGCVALIATDHEPITISQKLQQQQIVRRRDHLIGLVAPESDLNTLHVEITRTDSAVEEGRLVQTRVGERDVLYQVVAGISREEVLRELNRYGYARAKARKVGAWNERSTRFEPVKWMPLVNEAVLLVEDEIPSTQWEAVGHVPRTSYTIGINTSTLVTHNAAILGILGVGKTFLSFELIQRMLFDKIKVLCLDITDEYGEELGFTPTPELQQIYDKHEWGKNNYKQNKEEGGGVREFTDQLRAVINSFLDAPSGNDLLVIDPGGFDVWQQTGGMFQGTAAMASLAPSEVTRIITELALANLQAKGKSENARTCVVLEEAHTLVPEWNSAAVEGDQRAANGTAKAILQGRKYGLGCLLIAQRTANVTKTILNQCNTVFAMRSYDPTGLEFLRSYIGDDYSAILSTLDDRHAVLFGKASTCTDPVIVRLNDRPNFQAQLSNKQAAAHPPPPATIPPHDHHHPPRRHR